MNKMVIAIAIVATLVVALFTTGQVFAQGTTSNDPQTPFTGYGNGSMIGGRRVRGAGISIMAVGDGILHDTMTAVYAQELGVPVDDLNTRLASGETLAQIAVEKSLAAEQFSALMADARSQALNQASKTVH